MLNVWSRRIRRLGRQCSTYERTKFGLGIKKGKASHWVPTRIFLRHHNGYVCTSLSLSLGLIESLGECKTEWASCCVNHSLLGPHKKDSAIVHGELAYKSDHNSIRHVGLFSYIGLVNPDTSCSFLVLYDISCSSPDSVAVALDALDLRSVLSLQSIAIFNHYANALSTTYNDGSRRIRFKLL